MVKVLLRTPSLKLLFLQNPLNNEKFSQENQVKTFAEKFMSSKPAEFYSREISKVPDKRQEVIQNNGEYTID